MQINTLKIKYPKKKRKTIGRGGKKGTYSGRGSKGQKARSGSAINPLFEGGRSSLIDHLKKVRGFKSRNKKFVEVQVSQLGKLFKDKEAVDVKSLKIDVSKLEKSVSKLEKNVTTINHGLKKIDKKFDDLYDFLDKEHMSLVKRVVRIETNQPPRGRANGV